MMQRISKIVLCLRDRHVFVWQSLEILNVFNALTMKQVFLETKIFFQQLEYHFLVKSIKIKNNISTIWNKTMYLLQRTVLCYYFFFFFFENLIAV